MGQENKSNLVECYDCGEMYCGHCGHSNCPGGRDVFVNNTGPNRWMNGDEYREFLNRKPIFPNQ